jgi:omptin
MWTDRSQHPDTSLLWYFNGAAYGGYNFVNTDTARLGAIAGVRLIDVKWDAKGGTALYSDQGFRDDPQVFPAGQQVISYRQTLPSVFLGLSGEVERGPWLFELTATGGVTVNANDDDIHWARDLRFLGAGNATGVLHVSGKTSYAITDMVSVFVAGSLDHVADTRANVRMVTNSTGADAGDSPDGAGFGFTSASVTVGVSGNF